MKIIKFTLKYLRFYLSHLKEVVRKLTGSDEKTEKQAGEEGKGMGKIGEWA